MAIVFAPLTTATGQVFNQSDSEDIKLSARYHIEDGTKKGFIIVKAEIPNGSYIYSLSQKSPLIPSRLTFKKDDRFKANGKFKPDNKPKVIENDPIFRTRLEKHVGVVQFYIPIEVKSVKDFKSFKPTILYSGQVCSEKGFCKPINNMAVQAKFAGFFQREAKKPILGIREK